jgi:mono/diheme cytochrome c family protein
MSEFPNRTPRILLLAICCTLSAVLASTISIAADANSGKNIANRWCSSCHVMQSDQKLATDQAPPFASIAKMPGFDANKLAFLLLKPHPNMPSLSLSRTEIADLADFMATLK